MIPLIMNERKKNSRLLRLGLFVTLILPLTWISEGDAAEIMKLIGVEHVEVDKDILYLSDVVDIQGADIERRDEISEIEVGRVPPLGRRFEITERDIRQLLHRASINLDQIEISLPHPVEVTRKYMDVSEEYIRAAVQKFIEKETLYKNNEITIKNVRWAGKIRLPSGELTYQIQKKYPLNLAGSVPLSMLFFVDGKPEKRVVVVAQVEMFIDTAVAVNPISRGQVVQFSDLKLIRYELSRIKGTPISELDEIIGKRASRAIFPHQLILEGDVEVPPILKRGDRVKIVAVSERLMATAIGVVRENGGIGDKVKVVNIDSKKSLQATVIDNQTVRIEF